MIGSALTPEAGGAGGICETENHSEERIKTRNGIDSGPWQVSDSRSMENYVVQKAQQALEALAGDGAWKDRLASASSHLSTVTNDHFLASCPEDVAQALKELHDAPREEPYPNTSLRIQTAIELIFEEAGRWDLRRGAREQLS